MSDVKLCECGCGQPAPLARQNCAKRGYVKGEPLRFVAGHSSRGRALSSEHRARISESLMGHELSPATRLKISESLKAQGIRPSAEAIRKSHANRPSRDAHPSWKGGITITNGYRCLYQPDHPRAHPNGYVYEHIVVAEQAIGRALNPAEVVHHCDGNKLNNHPDNLRVFSNQAAHLRFHKQQGDVR